MLSAYVDLHEKCYHLYLAGLTIDIIQNIWLRIDDLERSNIFDDHLKIEATDSALGFINQFMIEYIGKIAWRSNKKRVKLLDIKSAVSNIYMSSKMIFEASQYGCDAIWYYNTFITGLIETDIEQKESRASTLRYIYAIKKTLRCNNVYKIDNDAVIYLGGVIDAVIKELSLCKSLRKMIEFCESEQFRDTYIEIVKF